MKVNRALKKFWKFVWQDNSLLSWITAFALVFIFIFVIFFPAMRLIFSTALPMVVIESGSMHHQYSFDQWYESCNWYSDNGINKEQFNGWNFNGGLEKGDIMVVQGQKEYKKGDVIIFKTTSATPIIHRIVIIKDDGTISTKGDNNCYQLPQELNINKDQIIGKAVVRIPYLGWAKVIWADIFNAIRG